MEDSKDFMISEALERLDDDTDFYRELVGDFLSVNENSINEIRESITSKNYDDLNHIAHSMKAALANLGAMTASGLCFELEKIGRFKVGIDQAPQLLESLQAALVVFEEKFSQFVAEL